MSCTTCLQESQPHGWIVMKDFQSLHEELPDIIRRFTNRLVTRFDGRASAIQVVDGVVVVTREHETGLDMQLRKRKLTSGQARQSEQLDAAIAGARDPRGRGGYVKDQGVHEDVCIRSKCGRCK